MRSVAFLAGSALALLSSSPAGAEDYTFLISDRPSGTMQVTQQGQERSVAFSFNDRGRGVDLKQVSRFGPGGTIRSTPGHPSVSAPMLELAQVPEFPVRTPKFAPWQRASLCGRIPA